MEEVWKDISLSTLHQDVPSTPLLSIHHHYHRTFHTSNPNTTSSFGGITLEDFLADAPKEATPVPPPSSRPPASIDPSPDNSVRFFGYDLNTSACDCTSIVSSFNDAHSECTKKRLPEQQPNRSIDGQDGAERRKKRIIKNRESAARSRARKQAYINELELEAARLLNENHALRRELEELRMTVVAAQNPTASRRALQRTVTAPF
ncbi:Basic region leucine zipper [Musa troglodytarum]|uniref:Basic region leucine zipper n=2 Tax=Musa troglodytarum TaxID=320322 RepID=A0A9E7FAD7_9LILI|nr:Basic region leucine zipper [Musa troglodytarum]URD90586.1 Basic region leucine zipper [Musa troglodytarum]